MLINPFSPEVVSVKTQTPACVEGCTLLPRNIPLPTGPNQGANEWGWGCRNKGNTMCEDTGVREHVCSGESKLFKRTDTKGMFMGEITLKRQARESA